LAISRIPRLGNIKIINEPGKEQAKKFIYCDKYYANNFSHKEVL
jgi:hypothetical protein